MVEGHENIKTCCGFGEPLEQPAIKLRAFSQIRKFENSTLQLTWSGLKNNETYTANFSLTSDFSP